MLVDSHCHFNSLARNIQKEVADNVQKDCRLLDSSIDLATSKKSLELSEKHDFLYTALGFHPFSLSEFSEETLSIYRDLIDRSNKVKAIGEIGLDYKAGFPLEEQLKVFECFLHLAKEKDLAVLIHNRMPKEDKGTRILEVIDRNFSDCRKVVFHCFSYSPEFLKKIVERKGSVSFSLNVFRKNKDIMASLKECPLENLMLETDSPYMRLDGQVSTPLDIFKVYEFVAKVRDMDKGRLEESVFSNNQKLFAF